MFPIKHKSGVFEAFRTFKAFAETQSECKIKALRDDKGGEYMSNVCAEFTTQCGILHQHTVQAHPQQNGVAKQANRLLSERITAILHEPCLPVTFWGEALGFLVHVWNRCPTGIVDSSTPFEL